MLLALLLALPDALLQRPYNAPAPWERVSGRCPMPVAATRVVAGSLPPGLRMSTRGAVDGVPSVPGNYAFTVEISDGCTRYQEERQIRVTPAPILLAETEKLAYECVSGAPPFAAKIIRISGSSPGLPYTVDVQYPDGGASSPWLRPTLRNGALPADGESLEADVVSLTVDPGKLPAGDYQARLRVSAWQSANTPVLLFRLHVDSPLAILNPIAPAPQPIEPSFVLPAPPSLSNIIPPPVHRPSHASTQKRKPHPSAAKQEAPPPRPMAPARSRVLPYPKVTLPKRKTKPVAPPATILPGAGQPQTHSDPADPVHGIGAKGNTAAPHAASPQPAAPHVKEPPPARTKPSAMPPHESSAAKHD
ncbi:MAG TPA: putative Ig domain-containing protein [Bryobacteraceae bacterium]|nr:putative Ig domain-containing protein [Bryobacteraceae bacterium]